MDKIKILSSLWLKILACLFMTFDHIGLFLELSGINPVLAMSFRIIGRISFPLFIFLIFEGCQHTSNIKKYLLRIGLYALICSFVLIGINYYVQKQYNTDSIQIFNIFTTLFICILIYYLVFVNKNKYLKLLLIFPIGLLIIGTLITFKVIIFDSSSSFIVYSFLPDYSFYSLILCPLFIAGICFYKYFIKNKTEEKQNIINLIFSLSIVVVCLVCYGLTYVDSLLPELKESFIYSTYSLLSVIFILLYNGKKGYDSKVLQYGFYLYYPLHILIIFLCFMLV